MEVINSPVNNCHQQIFRELDELRHSINQVKEGKSFDNTSPCCLSKNRHTASTSSMKKVTQVQYNIVPGANQLKYEGRHHLDDSEMRKVLHWPHVLQDSDQIEYHEAHRQTFKHPKPVQQSPRYLFQNKKPQLKKKVLKIERMQTEQPQLRKVTSAGSLAKMNPQSKIHKLVEADKKNYAEKQLKSQINASLNDRFNSSNRQLRNNGRQIQTEPFEEDISRGRRQQQRQHKFNQEHNQQKSSNYQLTEHRNRQYQTGQYQTGQQSHRSQQQSSRRTGSLRKSNRKQGYLMRRQRLKIITYDDITASSDSYFSPYEDQI